MFKSKLKRTVIKTVLLLIVISIQSNSYAIRTRKVLVLHSYHEGLSWTAQIIKGIDKVLNDVKKSGMKIEVDYEYMDTKRFVSADHYKTLFNLYKEKGKKINYDVIISVDDNALNFLFKHRDEIFGKIPVVFCGVNYFKDSMIKEHKLYTGVVEAFDFKSTVNLVKDLHPETKEIYVVGDNTTSGIKNKKTVQNIVKNLKENKIKFKYLNNGDIDNYQKILSGLKKESIIFAMLFNRDSKGNFYSYENSLKKYSHNVTVPIYSFWDFYLNNGIVGGMIISGESQGSSAAKMALHILMGEKISDLPVIKKSPNKYMFDYNILRKFNIDLSALPKEKIILNKPITYFDKLWIYREMILITFLIIFSLIFAIVILSLNILKRKKLEKELISTNKSFDRFVPHQFLDNLEKDNIIDVNLGDNVNKKMTVMFSDIRSFTSLSEKMTPQENFEFLNSYLKIVAPVIRENSGFIDKFIGDAVMAIFPNKAEDALKTVINMNFSLFDYNVERAKNGNEPISIGIGLHYGDLMMGMIGDAERMEGTVISDAVNLASRLEGLTKIFGAQIIVSDTVLLQIGKNNNKYNVRHIGSVQVKGKKEDVELYEVLDGLTSEYHEFKMKTKRVFEMGVSAYKNGEFEKSILYFEKIDKLSFQDKAVQLYLKNLKILIKKPKSVNWNGVLKFNIK